MASNTANLVPPLLVQGRRTLFRTLEKLPFFPIKDRQYHISVVIATDESSDSSSSLTIVKSVQNVATDKLPLLPNVLELIRILFSTWFVYRYLLFKPDRKELFQIVNKTISNIWGQ